MVYAAGQALAGRPYQEATIEVRVVLVESGGDIVPVLPWLGGCKAERKNAVQHASEEATRYNVIRMLASSVCRYAGGGKVAAHAFL